MINTKVLKVPVLTEAEWEDVNQDMLCVLAQGLEWEQFNFVVSADKEQKGHIAQVLTKLFQETDLKLEGDRMGRECHGITRKRDREESHDKDE